MGFRKKHIDRDDDFIVELYHLYATPVKKTIISKLHSRSLDDIEDCVQEVFVVAVKKQHELRSHPNLIGWFTVTAKNISMKHNEKFLKEKCVNDELVKDIPDPLILDEQVGEDLLFIESVKDNVVEKVFDKLDADEKKLYKLRWIQHLSYSDIEKNLDLSPSTVKNRLLRLRRHIEAAVKSFTG